jgi:16S rRNA (cytosine967-C5)-methyltransferase
MSESLNARLQALHVLQSVMEQGESLSTALPTVSKKLDNRDAAFCQMLVYGVLRWRWRLEKILSKLVQKPLKAKDSDIQFCLLLGLYQLMDTRVPQHAAVDVTVKLVQRTGKKWAGGLANAVLRNFIRSQHEILAEINKDECAHYSHPRWLIQRLKQDWPQEWQAILNANNCQAPMTLRVNRQRITVEEFMAQLAVPFERQGDALVLQQACDVHDLPGYEQGWFAVQDAGAQFAAGLLDVQPRQRVLDACAAPGGKTAHILELQPQAQVLALDVSESRLQRVTENLVRLGHQAQLKVGDASQRDWWDGQMFDRILLDAPCSATGVIRRHPDIKSLRRDEDIARLAATQRTILHNLWSMLAPGGVLLYATCSVLRDENERQIEQFLAQTPDAAERKIEVNRGREQKYGRQILPGDANMDGFYYALLIKQS